eukprot:11219291-Alexandrium_andersonii.AAC.1
MQNGFRRSNLEQRGSRNDLSVGSRLHPPRPRPGGSASFCALNPVVTAKPPRGRAGGALRVGPGGRTPPPPGKMQCEQPSVIRRSVVRQCVVRLFIADEFVPGQRKEVRAVSPVGA